MPTAEMVTATPGHTPRVAPSLTPAEVRVMQDWRDRFVPRVEWLIAEKGHPSVGDWYEVWRGYVLGRGHEELATRDAFWRLTER